MDICINLAMKTLHFSEKSCKKPLLFATVMNGSEQTDEK